MSYRPHSVERETAPPRFEPPKLADRRGPVRAALLLCVVLCVCLCVSIPIVGVFFYYQKARQASSNALNALNAHSETLQTRQLVPQLGPQTPLLSPRLQRFAEMRALARNNRQSLQKLKSPDERDELLLDLAVAVAKLSKDARPAL